MRMQLHLNPSLVCASNKSDNEVQLHCLCSQNVYVGIWCCIQLVHDCLYSSCTSEDIVDASKVKFCLCQLQ